MKHKPTGATSPERGTTGRGTAIEWRRYFGAATSMTVPMAL